MYIYILHKKYFLWRISYSLHMAMLDNILLVIFKYLNVFKRILLEYKLTIYVQSP